MVEPVTDDDRVVGVGQAKGYDPISVANENNFGVEGEERTTTVSIDGYATFEFQPPVEEAWIVKDIDFEFPVDTTATSGTMEVEGSLFSSGAGTEIEKFLIKSTYSNKVAYKYNEPLYDDSIKPATKEAIKDTILGTVVTNDMLLRIVFTNNTDVTYDTLYHCYLNVQKIRKTT